MPTLNDTNNNHSRTIIMSSSNDTNNNSNNKLIQRDLNPAPITNTTSTLIVTNNNNNNNNNNHHNNHDRQMLHINNNNNTRGPRSRTAPSSPAHAQHQSNQQHYPQSSKSRSKFEWLRIINSTPNFRYNALKNEELVELITLQLLSDYKLENVLGKDSARRCVDIRRQFIRQNLSQIDRNDRYGVHDRAEAFSDPVDSKTAEFDLVNGACCENVIGYVRVPVGVAGPLKLDGEEILVPLATTEGCLVASTNRGMSALHKSGGVESYVSNDFMTRAPIVRFLDTEEETGIHILQRAKVWLEKNAEIMSKAFNYTSKHAKLLKYTAKSLGEELHIRFEAETGDAMGMNMCSKGAENALKKLKEAFPAMEIVTLSGNMCTDKKPSAMNWINGRGKEVECHVTIPADIVHSVFKVSIDSMIERYVSKVLKGSLMAGNMSFNCQAANIVTAIFIATGQDPAQNVTSANCMLDLRKTDQGSLRVSCKMPSLECGTVGGGTILRDQSLNLQMMGIRGSTPENTKEYADGYNTNACKLGRIICATVMAAELSLLAALTQNTLVKSHMRHNRSSTNVIMVTSDGASTFS